MTISGCCRLENRPELDYLLATSMGVSLGTLNEQTFSSTIDPDDPPLIIPNPIRSQTLPTKLSEPPD